MIALVLSGLIDLAGWLADGRQLSGHINIVGYSTFFDYDSLRPFLAYRLIIYAFPVGAAAIYMLLERWGPLRAWVPLFSGAPIELRTAAPEPVSTADDRSSAPIRALLCVIPGALFAELAMRTRAPVSPQEVTWLRLAAAAGYAVVVLVLAVALRHACRQRGIRQEWSSGDWISLANGVAGAALAMWGLWFVSQQTVVVFQNGSMRAWPFIPWWLASAGTVLAWGWTLWRLGGGRTPADLEQRLRVVLIGAAAMYVLIMRVPGSLASFEMLDPTQATTGGHLLALGYFPWRDFQFIHGLLSDGWVPWVGFQLFQPTAWGNSAATYLVFLPLGSVSFYLLGVWAAPRRSLVVVLPVIFFAWGVVPIFPKFILEPIVLIAFGMALSNRRPARWTVLLMVLMFTEAIIAPESAEQVIAILVVLVLSEIVHRPQGASLWTRFERTRWAIASGAVLAVSWVVFLAAEGALSGWIDYYRIFVPGHSMEGALPLDTQAVTNLYDGLFALMVVVIVCTFLWGAWKLRYRRAWTPRHWLILAAAFNAAFYGEQALGRWDNGHVFMSFMVGLELLILILASAIPRTERAAVRLWSQLKSFDRLPTAGLRSLAHAQPFGWAVLLLLFLYVPNVEQNIRQSPGNSRVALGPQLRNEPKGVGYASPGAIPPGTISDFRRIVDTYASAKAPFLDMTNDPGWFYDLLGLKPASTLTNINQALPESAQELMVDQLRKTRPPLVAFTDQQWGDWFDGIADQVRSFAVSQYVLDNYTPVIKSHQTLFMLRNDMYPSRPAVPNLSQTPVTTGLYSTQPSCQWGDSADFLKSKPAGRSVSLRADAIRPDRELTVAGWAYDFTHNRRIRKVVMTVGDHEVGTLPVNVDRPDIRKGFHNPKSLVSGYSGEVLTRRKGEMRIYALAHNGELQLLPFGGQSQTNFSTIVMSDGRRKRTLDKPVVSGNVDEATTSGFTTLSEFSVPTGMKLGRYALATFKAPGALGTSQLTLSDVPAPTDHQSIVAGSLPLAGNVLSVRVGSCTQWHAFRGHRLYVEQTAGTPITSLTLSGVKP